LLEVLEEETGGRDTSGLYLHLNFGSVGQKHMTALHRALRKICRDDAEALEAKPRTSRQSAAAKAVNKIADPPGHMLVLRLVEAYRLLSGIEPPTTANSRFAKFVSDVEATFIATATKNLKQDIKPAEIQIRYRIKDKPTSIRFAVEEWKREHSRTSLPPQ
jgi:hypothetical protein